MTTFTVAVSQPRSDLHISKRKDGVYVSLTGDSVYLKQGGTVTIITKVGFSIFAANVVYNHGELYPAKEVHVSARMWGPYEE
ncbi:hypothetical protein phiIBBPAA2_0010 [Pseudomonas phage phiIBB-PAA2]|uniref:Uncharacterized protein n=1 Tax=Pseudomonas phage phiIBB-PAA2 TaxID=1429758 RepID=V5R611_9CAUD|nr:hypothetical protein phiIBBPAA2_0010 [Pseudomonas phage phiIBB-PAA2]YP_009209380.1 hypothetical protein AVU27_gp62 [Pseudomonas phage DL54]AFD10737.1 hypothetical protein I7C_059c [Pseudomonas phage MR299-2]UPO63132.1 hypothetical protein [Pseudomonas phage ZCPS1]WFG37353.1 hypothetical protein 7711_00044 [Pseudomonas phage bmx-p1]CCM43536.1 hypothetical protein BN377_1-14_Or1_orf_56 [Pseudomonas phage vB_PaeP_C1-14_Or]AHB30110.1 hypothetical protein phiIBBPAA2_0010 [Pseudomonas phage phiI